LATREAPVRYRMPISRVGSGGLGSVIGNGVSGSRTGTVGCGSASGGKGIGAGFGFCGSDGSCGVTGGISGFSIESVFSAALRVISACAAVKGFFNAETLRSRRGCREDNVLEMLLVQSVVELSNNVPPGSKRKF
jgi:hypothetical protein